MEPVNKNQYGRLGVFLAVAPWVAVLVMMVASPG
jgi:hypothetical protein